MSQRNLHAPWVNQNGTALFKGGWMKKHIAVEMSTGCKGTEVWFAKVSPKISSSLGLEGIRAHSNSGQCLAVLPLQSREISHCRTGESCLYPAPIPEDAGSWDRQAGPQQYFQLTHSQAALAMHGSTACKGERPQSSKSRALEHRQGWVLQSPAESCAAALPYPMLWVTKMNPVHKVRLTWKQGNA